MEATGGYLIGNDLRSAEWPARSAAAARFTDAEADSELVNAAIEAKRAGATYALGLPGRGAVIQVNRLVVNIVDFKPSRFTMYTAREVTKLLASHA